LGYERKGKMQLNDKRVLGFKEVTEFRKRKMD
jgi:hypothetical protein